MKIQYLAIEQVGGKGLVEVLVTRENGRQVSQTPTGRTFRNMKVASAAMAEYNQGK